MNNKRAAVSDKFSLLICLKEAAVASAIAVNGGIIGEGVSEYPGTVGWGKSVCG